ncbi:hypothetical protein [Kaarinaea lacus]
MRKITIIALMVMVLATPVAGASESGGIAVGLRAGILGGGVELNYPISKQLTVSAGINKYKATQSGTTDGIDYDTDINLETVPVLAHFHPFSGSFHLTIGAMINNNEFKMVADSNTTYDIGGMTYTSAEVGKLSATVNFKKVAPYLGVGWGFSYSSGIGFNVDLGILMQGSPKVDLKSRGGTLSSDAAFQAELDEEEQNAEDDLSEFTVLPVVSTGINWRF